MDDKKLVCKADYEAAKARGEDMFLFVCLHSDSVVFSFSGIF